MRRLLLLFLISYAACSSGKGGSYKIAIVPSRTGQHGIFVMNSDMRGGKLVTPDERAQLLPSSWSPDGSRIAFFSSRREDKDLLDKYRMPGHNPLYVMDVTGSNLRRLLDFPVSSFSWAPDGSSLLFVSAYEDPGRDNYDVVHGSKPPMSAVYILSLSTGRQRRLTDFGQRCSASWSPDGTRLAISLGGERESHIYAASVDGKHVRRLTDSPTIDIRPAWSPNGRTIAYVAVAVPGEEAAEAGAYAIDADGTSRKLLTAMPCHQVDWSTDGELILFQTPVGIYLAEPDGKNPVKLAPRVSQPLQAVFTPDGRSVMFRSNHEGDWHLYTVDLRTKNVDRVTGQLTAFQFSLSPRR